MRAARQRLAHIDGLRAVAILGVVGYHVGLPGFRGGFVGVDVFFVISGFLITGLIVDRLDAGTFTYRQFYAERVLRIFPPLLLVICVTLLAAALLKLSPFALANFGETAAASAAIYSNFYFIKHAGYFATPADREAFLHTWSLSVEEQYYLAAPVVLVLLTSYALYRKIDRNQLGVVVSLASLVLSFALALLLTYGSERMNNIAFYATPMRAWEFAAGSILAFGFRRGFHANESTGAALSLAGVAAVVAAMSLDHENILFPGWIALVPVIGTCLIIVGGQFAPNVGIASILSSRPFAAIGFISYSWYLWHWPVLVLIRMYEFGEPNLLRDAAAALGSMVLAAATYLTLERRMKALRRADYLISASQKVLAGGVGAAIVVAAFGVGFESWNRFRLESGTLAAYGVAKQKPTDNCIKRTLFDPRDRRKGSVCSLGVEGKFRVLVWGDSHAESLAAGMAAMASESGSAAALTVRPGCVPLLGVDVLRAGHTDAECSVHNDKISAWIDRHRAEGLVGVILHASWGTYVGDKDGWPLIPTVEAQRQDSGSRKFGAALERTLAMLDDRNLRVLLLGPVPVWSASVPECLYEADSRGLERIKCAELSKRNQLARAEVIELLKSRAKRHRNVKFIDPFAALCEAGVCRPYSGEAILYRDQSHLSDLGSLRLFRSFPDEVAWTLGNDFSGTEPR